MKLVVALLGLGLSACLPAPYGPYYRPSYPEPSATLEKAYCGGHAGPPSTQRIDGREHVLKPIELERRLFDGGIEPFNC